MHRKVLPSNSVDILNSFEKDADPLLSGWILAGGTGLALRLGHRVSDDLDLFRTDELNVPMLHAVLARHGAYETLQEADHTLTVLLNSTKLSFFRVRDPFLFEPTRFGRLALADVRDIALMKLAAISGRGCRKDFADLYFILQDGPSLAEYFELLPRKYDPQRLNAYHILKSLTYFRDAESEPMPRMLLPFDWKECRAFFVREARAIALR